jgi:hypothetical protein
LIHGERFLSAFLTSLINGYEPAADGFGTNVLAQAEATVKANPSIKMTLEILRRTVEEILAYTELIPEEFTQNAGSYYRFGGDVILKTTRTSFNGPSRSIYSLTSQKLSIK